MNDQNPFDAPEAAAVPTAQVDSELKSVAAGQRMVILAVLLYLAAVFLQFVIGSVAGLILLATLVLGLIGLIRVARGLGTSIILINLMVICLLIPLVGLIVLLSVNGRATRALRAGGYRVGLLGAAPMK